MDLPYAHYWLAALSTGYASGGEWIRWADAKIIASEKPHDWVIELAIARDPSMAMAVIRKQVAAEDDAAKRIIGVEDAQIGFYYLQIREKRLAVLESLKRICQVAETGVSGLSPEDAYALLCKFSPSAKEAPNSFLGDMDACLRRFGEVATLQWNVLTEGAEKPTGAG